MVSPGRTDTADVLLHRRFLRRAARQPGSTAVTFGRRSLTYGELAARAETLANALRARGLSPGEVVGVAGDGPALIVGMLAVCVAGGVYLPLNARHPESQLTFMLRDAGARFVLGTPSVVDRLSGAAATIVVVSEDGHPADPQDAGAGPSQPGGSAPAEADTDRPLYIIYTSGSSGMPKGVLVTHHNVSRLFDVTEPLFGFASTDVWTFFHSFAFDFSVWEIWGALLYGGRLVMVDYATSRDPWAYYRLVRDEKVTVLNQTPSAFVQFDRVDAAERASLALRTVILGGERLAPQALAGWWSRRPATAPRLVNMYGITETTVHVTYRALGPDDVGRADSPIGRPLADLEVSLRDAEGVQVPDGEVGEIYVAGAGVAVGYVNRPELTAQRFVVIDGRRWYRSGDLAVRIGGELHIHGRADDQVKIRGHRIEPGQVQAALERVTGVLAARVLAQRTDSGVDQLVGYVVTADGFDAATARAQLVARLPDYMVPAVLVRCDELPLTVNGKLDRAALPRMPLAGSTGGSRPPTAPPSAPPAPTSAPMPASTLVSTLAEIWCRVLDLPSVDVDDNFFALGGDSLLAVDVVAEATARGLNLTVSAVLSAQTVAELATTLATTASAAAQTSAESTAGRTPAGQPGPFTLLDPADAERIRSMPEIVDAFPMTPLQLAMAFHSVTTTGTVVYQNVTAIDVGAPFDEPRFRDTLAAVLDRYPMLRSSFALGGYTEPVQLIHARVAPPLTVQSAGDAATATRLAEQWSARTKAEPPELGQAPLLRVHVVATETGFTICWRIHHAIMDGWSDALFVAALVGGYLDGAASHPPESTTVLARHVQQVRHAAESAEHREYWRRALRSATPTRLPRPAPRPDRAEFPKLLLSVPDATARALRRWADRYGMPVKSLYLAAFAATISEHTGVRQPTVGLVVNTRPESAESTTAIGLFLNTVPVTLDGGGRGWAELARAAFEVETRMLPHRAVPLGEILPDLAGRVLGTVFNYVRFAPLEALRARPDVPISEIRSWDETDFPLLVNVVDATDRTALEISFRTDEVDPTVAARIGRGYLRALAGFAADPEALVPSGRAHVPQGAATVPDAVQRVVQANPDAVAVRQGDRVLTYRQLWAWSGRIAVTLGTVGIGPGVLVPVLTGRCVELVVAALAVLRAGAGYALLDPDWPADRLAEICARMSAPALLVGAGRTAPPGLALPLVQLPAPPAGDDDRQPGPPSGVVDADAPMAVFFTSGSTGRAKGALIAHRSLLRLLAPYGPYGFGRHTQVVSLCALPWDFATMELWAALTTGGVLHFPRSVVDGSAIAGAVAAGANTVLLPTGLFHALVEDGMDALRGVGTCLVGGEAMSVRHARRLLTAYPDMALFNVYGPVETCGGSTYHRVTAADLSRDEMPLGVPVPGDTVRITDPTLREVPPGTVGELVISGEGLATRYLDDLPATAEHFVTLASDGHGDGVRGYRTGDLAVRCPDSTLLYRGRRDRQVKLAGVRTELSEVEQRAIAAGGVDRAVAITLPSGSATPTHLALFFTGTAEPAVLAGQLAASLPGLAAPRAVLKLAEFPLTANGKVDAAALARDGRLSLQSADGAGAVPPDASAVPPDNIAGRPDAGAVPPDDIAATVLGHARRILNRPDVGLSDDFFRIGGNSLSAIRLAAAVSHDVGLDVSVVTLLTARRLDVFAIRVREVARCSA
jgi:amino acid adenylation domain-containing protein